MHRGGQTGGVGICNSYHGLHNGDCGRSGAGTVSKTADHSARFPFYGNRGDCGGNIAKALWRLVSQCSVVFTLCDQGRAYPGGAAVYQSAGGSECHVHDDACHTGQRDDRSHEADSRAENDRGTDVPDLPLHFRAERYLQPDETGRGLPARDL